MTFTEEQIREAVRKAIIDPQKTEPLIDYIMRELTRPQPEFREGEVVMNKASEVALVVYLPEDYPAKNYRKLRLSEMPKAVERLRKFVAEADARGLHVGGVYASYALADFDREIEP